MAKANGHPGQKDDHLGQMKVIQAKMWVIHLEMTKASSLAGRYLIRPIVTQSNQPLPSLTDCYPI